MSTLSACNCAWNDGHAPAHMVGHHANCPAWTPRPGALGSPKRPPTTPASQERDPLARRAPTGEWRNDAADRLHEALHTLGPRIPNLDVGDCHCNLLTQVALDALSPNLAEASNWEYFAGLAFAYHDAPEGTDDVDVAWSGHAANGKD